MSTFGFFEHFSQKNNLLGSDQPEKVEQVCEIGWAQNFQTVSFKWTPTFYIWSYVGNKKKRYTLVDRLITRCR